MLGIETQEGFGLGNQLFFYITTRCIALDKGYAFSVLDPEHFANNMHSDCGLYFMDLDMGVPSKKEDYQKVFQEKETRLFAGNSRHDLTHGVYVTDTDQALFAVEDDTLLYGNLQAEDYFIAHKDAIIPRIQNRIKMREASESEKRILYGFLLSGSEVWKI